MLVATDSGEIYELLDSDGTNLHRGPLVQGHFRHGVRGLAVHPTNPDEFASAGADRTVRIWNRADRKMASDPEVAVGCPRSGRYMQSVFLDFKS